MAKRWRMWCVSVSLVCSAAGAALGSESAAFSTSTGTHPDADATATNIAEARRHFDNGVRLYQDQNYSAALAEFEAALKLKPGASSLSNIALCQKALFRYADAAETLEQLLATYSESLSPTEQEAARAAMQELAALTRQVVFRVKPEGATLILDGKTLSSNERQHGIRINVGEHTLVATAPGHTKQSRSLRVSSGTRPASVDVELAPNAGFVTVTTEQKGAVIAIDGQALDYDRWSGPLEPGEHLLQIYKTGHETVEEQFEVALGETKIIRASAGGALEESAVQEPTAQPTAQLGWYGLGAFNLMFFPDAPDGIDVDKTSVNSGALSWGGRAGYRLLEALGAELLIEQGVTSVTDACIENQSLWEGVDAPCDDPSGNGRSFEYIMYAFRLGGNLRVFSSGSRARFTSTLGFGAVTHDFELRQPSGHEDFNDSALNAYVLVEIGIQANLGRLLLEADFVTYVESRGSLGDDRDLFSEGGLKSVGFGIKAGWSDWKVPW